VASWLPTLLLMILLVVVLQGQCCTGCAVAITPNGAFLQGSLAFQPPPVLAAALYLAGACLAATTAPRVCSSALLTHRITLPWLHSLYRCLEPATVLLEPLLLALGTGRDHPQRRCLSGELELCAAKACCA
jgi:hypothetical protein